MDLSWLGWVLVVLLAPIVPYLLIQQRKLAKLQNDKDSSSNNLTTRLVELQTDVGQLRADTSRQQSEILRLQDDKKGLERYQVSLLEDLELLKEENQRLAVEIEGRPAQSEVRYGIATIGISGSGKTALTLPWANPLVRLRHIGGTQFDKYERTVSRVFENESRTYVQHVFEIYDWGGEHIDEAQTALVKLGVIHALILVVDLGPYVAAESRHVFSKERITAQLEKFNTHALTYFFATSIVQHCKHYVLFINKSDLLSGLPHEIEEQAKKFYQPLIKDMTKWSEDRGVNFEIIVGSAETGAGTRLLVPHLLENILPAEAHDEQLKKQPAGGALPAPITPNSAPVTTSRDGDRERGRVEHLRPAMRG